MRSPSPALRKAVDDRVNHIREKRSRGLYGKFKVTRTDGKSRKGQKHHDCQYFVLDVTHDPYAKVALRAYAMACQHEYPALALDLFKLIDR